MSGGVGASGGGVIRIDAFRRQAATSDASKGHFRVDNAGTLTVKSVWLNNRGQHAAKDAAKSAFENAVSTFFLDDPAKTEAVLQAVDPKFNSSSAVDLTKIRDFLVDGPGSDNHKLQQFGEDVARIKALANRGVEPKIIDKILQGKNSASAKITLQLKPEEYMEYVELQSSISRLIGPENQRPTIDVTIQGGGNGMPSSAPIGIVGGTGPLSDAAMLEKTMHKLFDSRVKPENIHIRLLSAPPPRTKSDFVNPFRTGRYTGRVKAFCEQQSPQGGTQSRHQAIVLASNTAHGNLSKMKSAIDSSCHDHIHDLVDDVVSYVAQTTPPGRDASIPLILGTDAAYEKELYPNRFAARGNEEGNDEQIGIQTVGVPRGTDDGQALLTRDQLMQVTSLNHKSLQGFINFAKQNGYDEGLAQKLDELIRLQITESDPSPTHVVLGCTELPLALGEHLIEELNNDPSLGVRIIDTEEFFAERYAELVVDQTPGVSRQDLHVEYPIVG